MTLCHLKKTLSIEGAAPRHMKSSIGILNVKLQSPTLLKCRQEVHACVLTQGNTVRCLVDLPASIIFAMMSGAELSG